MDRLAIVKNARSVHQDLGFFLSVARATRDRKSSFAKVLNTPLFARESLIMRYSLDYTNVFYYESFPLTLMSLEGSNNIIRNRSAI